MKKYFFIVCCFLLLLPGGAFAAEDIGVIVAAFGSTKPEARNSLLNFEKEVVKACPNTKVAIAFTSRKALLAAAKDGLKIPSLPTALAAMADLGLKKVVILPLHIFPGQEYSDIIAVAEAFSGMPKGIDEIEVLSPLLGGSESLPDVAAALKKSVNIGKNEAVIFMGHGGDHPGNMAYAALQYFLLREGPNYLVGLVEGEPNLEAAVAALKKQGAKKVFLAPLMAVAGVHAVEDMAGNENSYASGLRKQGFTVAPIMRGLVEDKGIVDIWLMRLKEGVSQMRGEVSAEQSCCGDTK